MLTLHQEEEVTSGYIVINSNYAGIPLVNHTFGLCEYLENWGGGSCPIAPGNVSLTLFPDFSDLLAGSYFTAIWILDESRHQLACNTFNLYFF